ncbi:MAG: translation elongation factor Ts [Patescibacteria group bacterium]
MAVSVQLIAKLREATGAGMMDVKNALDEAGGDESKAIEILRKKGTAKAVKRAGKIAAEGRVVSYIHGEGRVGVLVEVNCETDFVSRGEKFGALTRDVAMHIAAANPQYVSRTEVPAELVEKEKAIYRDQLAAEKKPAEMIEKILEGKIGKYFADICLLEQAWIKDDSMTIEQMLAAATGEIGEKIAVRRFARYEVGEGIEKEVVDFAAEVNAQAGM